VRIRFENIQYFVGSGLMRCTINEYITARVTDGTEMYVVRHFIV